MKSCELSSSASVSIDAFNDITTDVDIECSSKGLCNINSDSLVDDVNDYSSDRASY